MSAFTIVEKHANITFSLEREGTFEEKREAEGERNLGRKGNSNDYLQFILIT